MQTQDTASIQAKTRRIDVAILSDDVNLCAMLQHALAMSRKPRFRVDILSPANFTSDTCNENQLVFLDRIYRAQPYLNTLREFAISQRGVRSKIVLLLDEEELNHDLGGFAAAFKNGVDALLLRTEISLQKIIDLLQHSTSSLGSNAPEANRDLAFVTDSNSATTTSTPTATAPTQAQTTDDCFAHSLAIDLESERIHIAANRDSPLFDEADTILSLRDWEARLDARGAEQFNELLHNAVEYRNIVQAIHCQVTSDAGTPLAATIGEIQIKNNGQGRVVGASAELLVYAQREESAFAPREGFDNLFDPAGDSSELLVAQQGWENIARSLPMMCLLLDEGGYVTQIVNNEEHLHQQFPRAAIGRRLSEILDIDSLDNLVDTISRTLNTGKAHQQTIAFATSQGTRWLDTHITKLKGDAGLSRQAVWTAFDITATRHSYQELLKAHDELFHLLDEAPILFFQKDGNGRFLRANKTFCDHFNVRADVISGRLDEEVFRDTAVEFCSFGKHVATGLLQNAGQLTHYSYTEQRSDGPRQIFWQAIPLAQTSNVQVEGYAGFGLMIDPQALSAQAAGEITTEPEDGKSSLVLSGAVGRDFNAILNAIVQYTEMAIAQKNQAREQRIADHLEEVLKTATHAHELVAHKASRQNEDSDSKGTELQPLIEEVIEMMRPTMPGTLKLQTKIDKRAPAAMISETPFKQIVLQLLVSARNTAIAAQKESGKGKKTADQEILLTLSQDKLPNAECSACEDKVSGDYIVLAVHTRTADVSSVDLQKLIVAARTATKKNAAENVVAMAHNNNGHAIIERQADSLALQLLFRKA
ncbi:MAG: PAS domain-containing protein [Gammaproteobacteria bacterium]|nr:PAS domain-containing protein [Gammaproteobacteria bacterium]NND40265.1 PAS domain-containing protein [Pseudomonadales bacterium]NNM12527.1 PAS domain-containing protein [Pseudomonadales bacterium]RZV56643.1 MAG: hypothetical protein EX270_04630 [Pseudomonadales bacterium]